MAAMSVLEVALDRKIYAAAGGASPVVALRDLRFTVSAGQLVCLLGPSGSGKTTLLKMLAGIESGYEGRLMIAGKPPELAEAVGVMFQTPRLMPWLTVLENVRLVANREALAAGRAEALLREMALDDCLDAFPNRLSGGMQRRVALARSLVNHPPLLLLDEPFVSLDAPVAGRLRELLLEQWQARKPTVLFVTHDLREALHVADRILFLSASPGTIVLDLPVDLPRPRAAEGELLERLRRRLLEQHPSLLAGLAGGLKTARYGPKGAA